jgi:hypothetical protein
MVTIMSDDQEAGASATAQLRDRIFQARLQIEQLRRRGNIELLRRATDNLRTMLRAQRADEKNKSREK